MPDGNFRILQDGEFAILISGPGYILVDEKMVKIFNKSVEGNLSTRQIKILDQVTKEEKDNYYELIIEKLITPETIDSIDTKGLQAWEYNGEFLFVSRELKVLLLPGL